MLRIIEQYKAHSSLAFCFTPFKFTTNFTSLGKRQNVGKNKQINGLFPTCRYSDVRALKMCLQNKYIFGFTS